MCMYPALLKLNISRNLSVFVHIPGDILMSQGFQWAKVSLKYSDTNAHRVESHEGC